MAGPTQIFTKKAQVFVIEESATDTYLVQTAGSGFMAEITDAPLTIDGENYTPEQARGDFLSMDETPGTISASMSFRVAMRGGGAATTAPEFGEAIKACGFMETTNAGDVTYTPTSTYDGLAGNPGQSYSVTVLEESGITPSAASAVSYRVKGAFGNFVFTGNVGEPAFLEFTFTGGYEPMVDDGLETITYIATTAPSFRGATFATNIGGAYAPVGVENFVLDVGNRIAIRRDINDANGVVGARITGRRSFGSYDPEMVLVATEDFYANQRAGTAGTIGTGDIGGTAGNIYSLSVARAVLRPISMNENDGIRKLEVPFSVSSLPTDVEDTNADISLLFK